jgi:signal peptidase I
MGEIALTLGALLGVAVMAITLIASHTGIRTLVVRSGSMEPTIATGSMVLVQRIDATEIRVGDIVAVERPDHTRVTHRVLSLQPKGETVELTMKGDANEDPDPFPVTVRRADRLVWQAPVIGRTVAWLATAQGGFIMGAIATALATRASGRRSSSGSRRRGVRLRTRPALAGHAD